MAVWLFRLGPDLIVLHVASYTIELPAEKSLTLHVDCKDWRQPPSIAV
jgi:hypothetical protein